MAFRKQLSSVALVLCAAFLLSGCQGYQYVKEIFEDEPIGVYHAVLPGQTLYSIAQAYGLDLHRIQRLNRIADPTERRVLRVPAADSPAAEKESEVARAPGPKQPSASPSGPPTVRPLRGFLEWPTQGTLTSGFGPRHGRLHDGIDIAAEKGTAIHAAAPGTVVFSGWGPTGYGMMVIVKHQHHLTTIYAHNSRNLVRKGDDVERGQKVALMGSTGRSTGPHLHFEVRNDTHPKNPLLYLPNR